MEQICSAESKIFATLEWGCDLSFARDDLLGMVIVSVKHLQPYIMLTRQSQGQNSLTDPHATWVEDLALEMLEALYFDHKLLAGRSAPLLASSLVLAALFILSQNNAILKPVPAWHLQKLTAQAYCQFLRTPTILSMRLSDFWGLQ